MIVNPLTNVCEYGAIVYRISPLAAWSSIAIEGAVRASFELLSAGRAAATGDTEAAGRAIKCLVQDIGISAKSSASAAIGLVPIIGPASSALLLLKELEEYDERISCEGDLISPTTTQNVLSAFDLMDKAHAIDQKLLEALSRSILTSFKKTANSRIGDYYSFKLIYILSEGVINGVAHTASELAKLTSETFKLLSSRLKEQANGGESAGLDRCKPASLEYSCKDLPDPCTQRETPIDKLPDELLLRVFCEISSADLGYVKQLSCVCKKWSRIGADDKVFQMFAESKMKVLVLHEAPVPQAYFRSSVKLIKTLEHLLDDLREKRIEISEYSAKLTKALDIPKEIYQSLPYFDLAPLSHLEPEEWLRHFSRICPELKNVRFIQVSQIGGNAWSTTHAAVQVRKRIFQHFKEELGNRFSLHIRSLPAKILVFCVYAIARVSKKSVSLKCCNTHFDLECFGGAAERFPHLANEWAQEIRNNF